MKKIIPRRVKCPKCYGTKFFSGRYGQTACEECDNGYILPKELNKRNNLNKKEVRRDENNNL